MNTNSPKTENASNPARERFIAFSFASSDFLLEVSPTGDIVFTAGQVETLTGESPAYWVGKNWLELFLEASHSDLTALFKGVQRAGRIGPLMVDMVNTKKTQTTRRALMMGMTIAESPNVYLTLNATQSFFDFLTVGTYEDSRLLDGKEFESAAIKAFSDAKKHSKKLDITFLEADKIEDYKKSLSFEEARNFTESLQTVLKKQSFQGNTASQVDANKYAIIHDENITSEFIEQKIHDLVERTKPSEEGVGLKSKTVYADLEALNEREARRALIYTMTQIEKGGMDAIKEDLGRGFDDYLIENAKKISKLKSLVGKQAFKLHFQPIVFLPDETLCHYEALVRFSTEEGESPYELIVFGEDIGIAPDVDLAILRQAAGYIRTQKKTDSALKIAVNLSGQSIQDQSFFDKLINVIDSMECSPDNLMFEITESTAIGDLEQVNEYLQILRKRGFEICLDDFGAGAASFQYLNALDIDCVKIDGKYIRDSLLSSRNEAMVRNLVRMCQDLGVTTIAEMVETQEQLDYLVNIGVDKAQGWIFGRPEPGLTYKKRD